MAIYFLRTAQIIGDNSMQVAALQKDRAPTKVLVEYLNFVDIFL